MSRLRRLLRKAERPTPRLSDEDVHVGDHCWAISQGRLLVVLKTEPGGYEVCGAWEGGMSADDLELLAVIERPRGYEDTGLYYLD